MSKNRVVLAALLLFATLAHAEDHLSPTEERVRLSLGVVHLSNDTSLQSTAARAFPAHRSMRRMRFGLDKSDFEAKIEAMVRAGARHRLIFGEYGIGSADDGLLLSKSPESGRHAP